MVEERNDEKGDEKVVKNDREKFVSSVGWKREIPSADQLISRDTHRTCIFFQSSRQPD